MLFLFGRRSLWVYSFEMDSQCIPYAICKQTVVKIEVAAQQT